MSSCWCGCQGICGWCLERQRTASDATASWSVTAGGCRARGGHRQQRTPGSAGGSSERRNRRATCLHAFRAVWCRHQPPGPVRRWEQHRGSERLHPPGHRNASFARPRHAGGSSLRCKWRWRGRHTRESRRTTRLHHGRFAGLRQADGSRRSARIRRWRSHAWLERGRACQHGDTLNHHRRLPCSSHQPRCRWQRHCRHWCGHLFRPEKPFTLQSTAGFNTPTTNAVSGNDAPAAGNAKPTAQTSFDPAAPTIANGGGKPPAAAPSNDAPTTAVSNMSDDEFERIKRQQAAASAQMFATSPKWAAAA